MLGLYLHIPFCQHKCSYCDFYSIENRDQQHSFVKLLCREIELRAASLRSSRRSLSSIFLGGGTPSLLLPSEFEMIASTITSLFDLGADCEWTMECNPGTVRLDTLASYKANGVNRLSFGVQSFHHDELAFLERIHSSRESNEAVDLARRAGFDNINIDMMFALPNQSLQKFQESMRQAVSLQTEHISAYSLIFEEGTPLYAQLQKKLVEPQNEENDTEMYQWCISFLADNGYRQYEVSNFSRKDKECVHNLCYWEGREYLACGPSAHGYIDSTRYWNPRSLSRYISLLEEDVVPTLNQEQLNNNDKMFERCFLELRARGIEIARFDEDFGLSLLEAVAEEWQWMQREGFVSIVDGRLSLSSSGYSVCDDVSLRIIQALERATKQQWRSLKDPVEEVLHDIKLP